MTFKWRLQSASKATHPARLATRLPDRAQVRSYWARLQHALRAPRRHYPRLAPRMTSCRRHAKCGSTRQKLAVGDLLYVRPPSGAGALLQPAGGWQPRALLSCVRRLPASGETREIRGSAASAPRRRAGVVHHELAVHCVCLRKLPSFLLLFAQYVVICLAVGAVASATGSER